MGAFLLEAYMVVFLIFLLALPLVAFNLAVLFFDW